MLARLCLSSLVLPLLGAPTLAQDFGALDPGDDTLRVAYACSVGGEAGLFLFTAAGDGSDALLPFPRQPDAEVTQVGERLLVTFPDGFMVLAEGGSVAIGNDRDETPEMACTRVDAVLFPLLSAYEARGRESQERIMEPFVEELRGLRARVAELEAQLAEEIGPRRLAP